MIEADVVKLIQKHIYDHPLYNWCAKDEDTMSFLVIGDGIFASKFVDLCLQTGQMTDKKIRINWCVSNDDVKREYLAKRPALQQFINIDEDDQPDSYGQILFKSMEETMDPFSEECRYLFIATDDMNYNRETADLFKQAVREDCLAAYLDGEIIDVSFNGQADAPEYIEMLDGESKIDSYDTLVRMAFNTHRIWEGAGNLDYEKVKARFQEAYNFNSSVSFVLSIPYKLKSVGINARSLEEAADELRHIVDEAEKDENSEAAKKIARISYLEHRRWVLEKVVEGVVRLTDKNGLVNYAICIDNCSVKKKDTEGNLIAHPCLVKSSETGTLLTGKFKDKRNWDNSSVSCAELDDLDRFSIEIHRTMLRGMNRLKNNKGELVTKLALLKDFCEGNSIVKRDFDRFNLCIENVLDGSPVYASQYETYEKMLLNSIADQIYVDSSSACSLIAEIRRMLFTALEANMYRDYKAYDYELVKYIPFILTNKFDIKLCMPFGEASSMRANNDDYFRSVASATALYAVDILYLYVYEYTTNYDIFESKLKAVSNYFVYRGNHCNIKMNVYVANEETVAFEKLNIRLSKAKELGYIQDFNLIRYENQINITDVVLNSLDGVQFDYYDGTNALTRSALVNSRIVEKITNKYPYFEFDSFNKKFVNCMGCEYLRHIRLSSFIQVEDMFALLNAQDKEFNYQDYADSYMDYWQIYSGDAIHENDFALCARSWTKVSNILMAKGANNLNIWKEEMDAADSREKDTIKKMLKALENKGLLSNLRISNDDKVSVKIRDKKVKGIFTKAGDLLETYVYFEACKTGWFDDVQTGYKFKWEHDDITNELDCVLTKGYRSILVECKSTKNVDEDFYLILDSLADHFGIGYKKVLIAVTDASNSVYESYVSRGKQMDIITISKKADLLNIGQKLIDIMKSDF